MKYPKEYPITPKTGVVDSRVGLSKNMLLAKMAVTPVMNTSTKHLLKPTILNYSSFTSIHRNQPSIYLRKSEWSDRNFWRAPCSSKLCSTEAPYEYRKGSFHLNWKVLLDWFEGTRDRCRFLGNYHRIHKIERRGRRLRWWWARRKKMYRLRNMGRMCT